MTDTAELTGLHLVQDQKTYLGMVEATRVVALDRHKVDQGRRKADQGRRKADPYSGNPARPTCFCIRQHGGRGATERRFPATMAASRKK
jgi:hypothetical protein